MKKTFYEKIGRKYVPVSEHDLDLSLALPTGSHLITVSPGSTSTRYNVDPAYAPLIAAGIIAEEALSKIIMKATDVRPSSGPLTKAQIAAWKKLSEAFGESNHLLQWNSAMQASREVVTALQQEANKLLSNEAVKNAYEEFMIICKLTKETNNDHS
jgi:hypothetical protein